MGSWPLTSTAHMPPPPPHTTTTHTLTSMIGSWPLIPTLSFDFVILTSIILALVPGGTDTLTVHSGRVWAQL